GVPLSQLVRGDPNRQLAYARLAEQLNGDRGMPVLAEAMLLARQADATSEDPSGARTVALFRRAIEVDPWNPLGYLEFADLMRQHPGPLALRDREAPIPLLLRAVAVDPTNVAAIDRLLDLDLRSGRAGDAYALLCNVVFPRL